MSDDDIKLRRLCAPQPSTHFDERMHLTLHDMPACNPTSWDKGEKVVPKLCSDGNSPKP